MGDFDPDPKKRFSSRVDNYIKYRPGYPSEVIDFIKTALSTGQNKIFADIGSGTGIFSELLLKNNYIVYAVEPNDEMRKAAEKKLNTYSNFVSIKGSAEETGIDSKSIDVITAAQAFHWFETVKAKIEFKRILKPGGWIILLWNTRLNEASPFMTAYENFLLRNSVDYTQVAHTNIDQNKLKLFFSSGYNVKNFPNKQILNYESLKGRVLSSSYMPDESKSSYNLMLNTLQEIFKKCNENGFVEFLYKTELYFGKL
jgi:ubiquinone/menaquinone biosynthesis C-methylase UbiE